MELLGFGLAAEDGDEQQRVLIDSARTVRRVKRFRLSDLTPI